MSNAHTIAGSALIPMLIDVSRLKVFLLWRLCRLELWWMMLPYIHFLFRIEYSVQFRALVTNTLLIKVVNFFQQQADLLFQRQRFGNAGKAESNVLLDLKLALG